MRLETERLILRKPRLADAEAAFEYLGDAEVMRFLGGETVPREDCRDVIRKWLERWEANGFGYFTLERRDDGRFVGRVGLNVWHTETWRHATLAEAGEGAQPELAWTLVRAHWGNGYATEAARAVRDWARSDLGFERLISLIAPENVRSQNVAARLGARPTETITFFDGSPGVVWVHPR